MLKDITIVSKEFFFRLSALQHPLGKQSCFALLTDLAMFPGSGVLIWRGIAEYFIYAYIIYLSK